MRADAGTNSGPRTVYWLLRSKKFRCGFSDTNVLSMAGYRLGRNNNGTGDQIRAAYLCLNCGCPSFFPPETLQFSPPALSNRFGRVPHALWALYEEAVRWTREHCYTAAVLLCRKMLISIAVERGACEGLNIIEYICYLSDKGYVPPKGRRWVDHIKNNVDEAKHNIPLIGRVDARDTVSFLGMLLRFIYGTPKLVPAAL